jgi:DNA-binding NarL/FixJ family response regulator
MRVVIAEDHVLLREGLVRLLAEGGHQVTAVVSDAESLLDAVAATSPQVAIVDVRLPPSFTDEGIRAALEIRHRHPVVGLLVLSRYVEETYAAQLLAGRTRGVGYLLKDRVADVPELLDAVARVGDGGTVLDPEVVAQILARRKAGNPLTELTPREREVLALIAEGHSNTAIAHRLVISAATVEKHITSVFAKLQLTPSDDYHRRVLAVLTYLRH